jgi:hypothetical protein
LHNQEFPLAFEWLQLFLDDNDPHYNTKGQIHHQEYFDFHCISPATVFVVAFVSPAQVPAPPRGPPHQSSVATSLAPRPVSPAMAPETFSAGSPA